MKNKSLIVTTVLLILMVSPVKIVEGVAKESLDEAFSSEETSVTDREEPETTIESWTEESAFLSEDELDLADSSLVFSDEEDVSQESQSKVKDEPAMARALQVQDVDGFWLVDSAATLTELLKDNSKLNFRLTQDIDLGTLGYRLKNGVIIDGANHKITYNKGGSYNLGFYVDETNATVEIRNTQFGNLDGSGAIGYYGFLTGFDTGINMKFIFDNVDYYSNNGQMIYNRNGSIIMRGDNNIVQKGTAAYAQEWAETNYVEIQSGSTTVAHSSSSALAFIWSVGTNTGNPHANSSKLVVRKNAQMNIKTSSSMTYDYLAPSYIVEENAHLTIDKVSLASGDLRNNFFYMNQTQKVTFDFQKNSHVSFLLPVSINTGAASGGMAIGEGANVSIDVANGTIFSPTASSTFTLDLQKVEHVSFASSGKGTLGLNGGASLGKNVSFTSNTVQRIDTFDAKGAATSSATILRRAADLRGRLATYTNVVGSVDPLSVAELTALGNSQKLVFSQQITAPNAVKVSASNLTATTGTLHASSVNNGSVATNVKWFLFTAEADSHDVTKAQQVIQQAEFDGNNTVSISTYEMTLSDLTPNTRYWLRGVVINQVGESQLADAYSFVTKPALDKIRAEVIDGQSALISGRLLGGLYQGVTVEYSQDKQFPAGATFTTQAEVIGENKRIFTADLGGLIEDATYFVRLKVVGMSGEEVTLVETPLTEFTTTVEIINVEIPLEMAFQTENSDIGTAQEGSLHSVDYQLVNHGNVPTKVSLIGVTSENQAAEELTLRHDLNGVTGTEELALQLTTSQESLFITNELESRPLLVGVLGINSANQEVIRLNGKYFNPRGQVVVPAYKLTFKVEINR
ncbi:fibronectin type III domain-containing protein [uncultured Vagococcus sp.]|uniref:fibronectin type III domain-containing protein n=1 Tax=uncultured Vagococcus sp. TaxID=189676 RepID=UPI0028D40652|nr:fibronectin type III domain-containing protein [uncultured Vagococcus sp.]